MLLFGFFILFSRGCSLGDIACLANRNVIMNFVGHTGSYTHDRLMELERENASLGASVTSATRDALRKAEAENARLKAGGMISFPFKAPVLRDCNTSISLSSQKI